jgi:hypothetical protein
MGPNAFDPGAPLIEGSDFYWESGLMVLTGDYLRRRGYCCESGCRHCPYGDSADDNRPGAGEGSDETGP